MRYRPNVCIYTAILGGYDALKPAPTQTIPTDFFCFTDIDTDTGSNSEPWRVRRVARRHHLSPRMQAKWFKMHPHVLFPRGALSPSTSLAAAIRRLGRTYDYTIWIDGSLQITSPTFAADVIGQVGTSGLGVFPHPDRDCVFDEAVAASHWAKYKGQALLEQAEAYRQEGYPAHAGLVAAGVLVRATSATHLPELDCAWWQENLRWTCQDQVSLPVVWWRRGRTYDVFNAPLWTNKWFRYHNHPKEEGLLPEYL